MNPITRAVSGWSLALTLAVAPLAAAATPSPAPIQSAATAEPQPPVTVLAANDGAAPQSSGSLSDFEKAQDTSGYNSEYIFALTRGLANSTMHPAGKVPLFIFTLPLDVVFLPFAAIAGLFG